ncbi:hypothetical protein N9N67_09880, partial [Bacteriovoracaceae bacterium]|nr:hypothetical protein [Bacteriovoracaceae bacterium]
LFAKTKKYFIPLYSKIQNEKIIIKESEIVEEKELKLQIISSLSTFYYQAQINFSVELENKTFHAIQNKIQFLNLMEYLACY